MFGLFKNKDTINNTKTLEKEFKGYYDTGFSCVGNNLGSCGVVQLSLNSKFNFLIINSDIATSNAYIGKKVAINGLILKDNKGNTLEPNQYINEYNYLYQLFSAQTFEFWKSQFITQANIAGENFIEPGYFTNGQIQRFINLDARGVQKIIDGEGNITEFRLISKSGIISDSLTRDELGYFIYREDPRRQVHGIGVIDGIIFDALSDFEGARRNFAFFKNNAIPGALFILDSTITNVKEQKKAADALMEKFGGSDNAYKITASPHIKDVKILELNNRDMEFIEGRRYSTSKICSAFGLHPKLIGYEGKNGSFSEIKEIRQEIYTTTIRAYERYMENVINQMIQKYKQDLLIDLSIYNVIIPSETFDEVERIHENQRKDIEFGIKTRKEVRDERGLQIIDDKNISILTINSNIVTLDSITNPVNTTI